MRPLVCCHAISLPAGWHAAAMAVAVGGMVDGDVDDVHLDVVDVDDVHLL